MIKGRIPTIIDLVFTAALNAIENKINTIDWRYCQKNDCDAKIKDTEIKYFLTSDYNKFMSGIFDTKVREK